MRKARYLFAQLRASPRRGGIEGLVKEYALSSQEGVALMCLAEALLRIPDTATRDALIRDKIAAVLVTGCDAAVAARPLPVDLPASIVARLSASLDDALDGVLAL